MYIAALKEITVKSNVTLNMIKMKTHIFDKGSDKLPSLCAEIFVIILIYAFLLLVGQTLQALLVVQGGLSAQRLQRPALLLLSGTWWPALLLLAAARGGLARGQPGPADVTHGHGRRCAARHGPGHASRWSR